MLDKSGIPYYIVNELNQTELEAAMSNNIPQSVFIRAELMKKGYDQGKIARKFNVSRAYVSMIINGRRFNPEIARFINGLIGYKILPERREIFKMIME